MQSHSINLALASRSHPFTSLPSWNLDLLTGPQDQPIGVSFVTLRNWVESVWGVAEGRGWKCDLKGRNGVWHRSKLPVSNVTVSPECYCWPRLYSGTREKLRKFQGRYSWGLGTWPYLLGSQSDGAGHRPLWSFRLVHVILPEDFDVTYFRNSNEFEYRLTCSNDAGWPV